MGGGLNTFLKNIFIFIYHVYSVLSACRPAGQNRVPDLITNGCESPSGCWELNSRPGRAANALNG